MKVRFYRGPYDGKTRRVRDDQTHIFVSDYDLKWAKPLPKGLYSDQDVVALTVHRYVRTRHTHPDGSVFFEWDKPKGSKI